MIQKRNTNPKKPATGAEAEQLDALNARARRRGPDTRLLIEATIEEKAKKRRIAEAPASSKWKPTG